MLTALADGLRDLVVPTRCVACGGARGPLCPACTPVPRLLRVPVRAPGDHPLPCAAAGEYAGSVRAAVIAYKERGVRALAGPLGALLAAAVLATVGGGDGRVLLVPVPSTAAARRVRGEDHLLRLTAAAARRLRADGLRARVTPVLRVVRPPVESVGLGVAERWANLAGAFSVLPQAAQIQARTAQAQGRAVRVARAQAHVPARGQHRTAAPVDRLVLVDDIITTGATLAEACRAALAGGLSPVAAAAIAATPLNTAGNHRGPAGRH